MSDRLDDAQLLWQASDDMRQAADDAMTALEIMRFVAAGSTWVSAAGARFLADLDEAAEAAGLLAGRCAETAQTLLADGNARASA